MLDIANIKQLFNDFNSQKVLIIGDMMLDSYIWGKVDRISPEAPVPIVAVKERENRLGGAANVGLNVQALGAEAILCSVIGNDFKAAELRETLSKAGLTEEGIVQSNTRKTTVKFRVFANNTQLLRVDEESTDALSNEEFKQLAQRIQTFIEEKKISVVIFQDYDKGVITPELISFTVALAKKYSIPVTVDPKKRNFLHYKKVTLFKPNLKEMAEGLNKDGTLNTMEEIHSAAEELQTKLKADIVLNTLSEKGMLALWHEEGKAKTFHTMAHLRHVADVSGAGDTVISVASLCLALEQTISEMVELSNLAGGLVCEKVGVVPIDKQELFQEATHLFSSHNR